MSRLKVGLVAALMAMASCWQPAWALTINETGTSGAPVSVGACSGAATKVIASDPSALSWSLIPESGDIRCMPRTLADGAASPAPTATVGFLMKSNVVVEENNLRSMVVTQGLDCCGVSGAVSVDTWRE
jgi:hypothetical protein